MRKVWVLDTETKGTGAEVRPLKKARSVPEPEPEFWRRYVLERVESPEPDSEPITDEPRRFRIVDTRSRELLADDVDARQAVEALDEVRSVVDVSVYVSRPEGDWRLLTLGEQKALWRVARARR
jgi:hypothetical protein